MDKFIAAGKYFMHELTYSFAISAIAAGMLI